MSASTLPVLSIVSGPTAPALWNAAQHRRSQYFTVRPLGTIDRSLNRRIDGIPTGIATSRNESLLCLRLGYIDEDFLDLDYNVTNRSGTISCTTDTARVEWLGLAFDIVELLAAQGINTVGDALKRGEVGVCQALLEDLAGYGMSTEVAQRAIGRFVRLRERLQMLKPEIEFMGGTHRPEDLFMCAF